MGKTKYTLRYLPLFYDDLEELVLYISDVLCNKKAASDLIYGEQKMKGQSQNRPLIDD